jgi:hypothetical protein
MAPAQSGDLAKDLHDALCSAGMTFSADAVRQSEVRLQGGEVTIRAPKTMLLALRDAGVQRIASQVVGKPVKLRVEAGDNLTVCAPMAAPENNSDTSSDIRERALSHPGVKRFQELFPGAQIRNVRNLNE